MKTLKIISLLLVFSFIDFIMPAPTDSGASRVPTNFIESDSSPVQIVDYRPVRWCDEEEEDDGNAIIDYNDDSDPDIEIDTVQANQNTADDDDQYSQIIVYS